MNDDELHGIDTNLGDLSESLASTTLCLQLNYLDAEPLSIPHMNPHVEKMGLCSTFIIPLSQSMAVWPYPNLKMNACCIGPNVEAGPC